MNKELGIEELIAKLEKLTSQMENDDLPLQQSLDLYAHGVELTKECFSQLNKTKGEFTVLKEQADSLQNND